MHFLVLCVCASLESVVRATRLPGLSCQDLTCLPEDKAITGGGVGDGVVKQTHTVTSWYPGIHCMPNCKCPYSFDDDAGSFFFHLFLNCVKQVNFAMKTNLVISFCNDMLRHASTGAKSFISLIWHHWSDHSLSTPTLSGCGSLIFPGIQIIYHSDYAGVASGFWSSQSHFTYSLALSGQVTLVSTCLTAVGLLSHLSCARTSLTNCSDWRTYHACVFFYESTRCLMLRPTKCC